MPRVPWSDWIEGYVVVTARGPNLGQFLNLALAARIPLADVTMGERWLRARTPIGGFKALRPLARTTRSRVRIRRKVGLPFWLYRARRRPMLVWGALGFVLSLYFLSSWVWVVSVYTEKGPHRLPAQQILEVARSQNLRPGVLKSAVNWEAVKEKLKLMPEVSWAEIEIQGTRALIHIAEKTLPTPSEEAARQPAHVVAGKDAVIEDILVLAGHPLVKAGDAVHRGQVLVSAEVPPEVPEPEAGSPPPTGEPGTPLYVHARAIVRGRVEYRSQAVAPLVEGRLVPTGRKSRSWSLVAGSSQIRFGPKASPFSQVQVEEQSLLPGWLSRYLPVAIHQITYQEVQPHRQVLTVSQARERARLAARRQVEAMLPPYCRLVSDSTRDLNPEELEPGQVGVEIRLVVIEDIAVSQAVPRPEGTNPASPPQSQSQPEAQPESPPPSRPGSQP